jgi:hypothetical protein
MNEKAILEVGDLIRVRYKFSWFKRIELTPQEIIDSVEYQKGFKAKYPELARLIEE